MLAFDIHTHHTIAQTVAVNIKSFHLMDLDESLLSQPTPLSVGLHPWYTSKENFEASFKKLEKLALQNQVKMIGECGLDKLKGEALAIQIYFLEKQIALAEAVKKPLILHCVKSFQELIQIKETLQVKVPMVIHGFNKNPILGLQLIEKGFYLSFGKSILNENSNAAQLLPQVENFFLETDDAEVSIDEIYQQAAILKKIEVEALKERIFADWKKITNF